MAYRSFGRFRQASTHLDTPPFSQSHHPVSAIAPLVLDLTLRMGRNPTPYLLAVAMASNVGSTATITGNPQNIMIGSFSQIPYGTFALTLGPVALAGLGITVGLAALFHRKEFAGGNHLTAVKPHIRVNGVLVAR